MDREDFWIENHSTTWRVKFFTSLKKMKAKFLVVNPVALSKMNNYTTKYQE